MRRLVMLSLAGFLSLLARSAAAGDSFVRPVRPFEGVVIAKAIPLDQAFEEGKVAGRDFSSLEKELARMLTSTDDNDRRVAIGWIGATDDRFSTQEQDRLIRYCRGLLPSDYPAGLEEALVRLRWKESTQDERRRIYWEAVKLGKVRIWEGRELDRTTALVMAVGEGLEEFADAVRQHGPEMDDLRAPGGLKSADKLLWYLRLRAGAKDQNDGDRVQGDRLSAISDEEFARLMQSDSSFRHVALTFAAKVCDKPRSAGCLSVAAIGLRQGKQWEGAKRSVRDATSTTAARTGEKPEWLAKFSEAAGPGMGELQLQKAKAAAEKSSAQAVDPKN